MKRPISRFTRFFWFCSGANTDVLEQCPQSEHNRFVGIGAAVFFTGMLAAFSGGYALYTAFNSVILAVLFGLFWGSIIFNLDRFMVSTIKKEGSTRQQLLQAIPRFLLAIVLAIVISKPLELRIFEPEIMEVLDNRHRDKLRAVQAEYDFRLEKQEQALAALDDRLQAKEQARERDYQDYKCECDGTCGTGKAGIGPECERKKQKYTQSNTEYQQLKRRLGNEANGIRTEMEQIRLEHQAAQQQVDDYFAYGLVARLSASSELPLGPSIMIPLLIFLVEISPILAKILAPKGPYEVGLKQMEKAYLVAQAAALKEEEIAATQRSQLMDNLNQAEIEQQVQQRKQALQAISKAQLELVKAQIDKWLLEEKSKLKKKD